MRLHKHVVNEMQHNRTPSQSICGSSSLSLCHPLAQPCFLHLAKTVPMVQLSLHPKETHFSTKPSVMLKGKPPPRTPQHPPNLKGNTGTRAKSHTTDTRPRLPFLWLEIRTGNHQFRAPGKVMLKTVQKGKSMGSKGKPPKTPSQGKNMGKSHKWLASFCFETPEPCHFRGWHPAPVDVHGGKAPTDSSRMGFGHLAVGQNQKPVPPDNIRFNPTTKIGSKMGGDLPQNGIPKRF